MQFVPKEALLGFEAATPGVVFKWIVCWSLRDRALDDLSPSPDGRDR